MRLAHAQAEFRTSAGKGLTTSGGSGEKTGGLTGRAPDPPPDVQSSHTVLIVCRLQGKTNPIVEL